MSPGGRPATTTADDWAQAALDEIEDAGVRALTVEAVARRLGVSKGGAYHHFRDRRDLLRAALARWERRQVTERERIDEPRAPAVRRQLEQADLLGIVMQAVGFGVDADRAAARELVDEALELGRRPDPGVRGHGTRYAVC